VARTLARMLARTDMFFMGYVCRRCDFNQMESNARCRISQITLFETYTGESMWNSNQAFKLKSYFDADVG
jgi:hypothetical protein